MNSNKECGLLSIINSLPKGVGWIVRSDDEGVFANVMSSDFPASGSVNGIAYASTPAIALECAYRGFKAKQKLLKY